MNGSTPQHNLARHNDGMDAVSRQELVDRVLLAADLVPAGRVVSYGDIAELVGTSPRQVGRVMATAGHEVCWWRVVNSSGDLPVSLMAAARRHWQAEGITVNDSGRGCRIRSCRADLVSWATGYQQELIHCDPTDGLQQG